MSKLKSILKNSDINLLIIDLFEYVCKRCKYGQKITKLTDQERVFYITQQVETEINNGGFEQFFFNSSGDFSAEIEKAFTEIGAIHTAKICKKALSAFGNEVPTDRNTRQELLEELESDELSETFEECDDDFLEYQDDLNTLNYTYVMKNKAFFR